MSSLWEAVKDKEEHPKHEWRDKDGAILMIGRLRVYALGTSGGGICPASTGWTLVEEPEPEIPRNTPVQTPDGCLGYYRGKGDDDLYLVVEAFGDKDEDGTDWCTRPTPLTCPKCGSAISPKRQE